MRLSRPARRFAVLFAFGAGYLVLLSSRYWIPVRSAAAWRAWDAFQTCAGVIAFPFLAAFVMVRCMARPPVREWRIADAVVFSFAALLLGFFVDGIGYWVQETLLPLPPWLFGTLLTLSRPARWSIVALLAGTLLFVVMLLLARRHGRSRMRA